MAKKFKDYQRFALFLLFIIGAFILAPKLKPEQFDIFGIFVFSFLIYIANKELETKGKMSNNTAYILLLIGILGLIVDGYTVLTRIVGIG